jgi:hypothetical protein
VSRIWRKLGLCFGRTGERYMYRYMHIPHVEGNSKEGGKAVKPLVTQTIKPIWVMLI